MDHHISNMTQESAVRMVDNCHAAITEKKPNKLLLLRREK